MENKNKKILTLQSDFKIRPYNLKNQGYVKAKQNNLFQFILSLNKNENEPLPSHFLEQFASLLKNTIDNTVYWQHRLTFVLSILNCDTNSKKSVWGRRRCFAIMTVTSMWQNKAYHEHVQRSSLRVRRWHRAVPVWMRVERRWALTGMLEGLCLQSSCGAPCLLPPSLTDKQRPQRNSPTMFLGHTACVSGNLPVSWHRNLYSAFTSVTEAAEALFLHGFQMFSLRILFHSNIPFCPWDLTWWRDT